MLDGTGQFYITRHHAAQISACRMPYDLKFLREDLDKVDLSEDYHDVIPSAGNWSKLEDSDELRRNGNELYERGKYEEAYEIYGRALKLIPMAKRIPVTFVPLAPIRDFMLRCQALAAKCFNNMSACILVDKKAEAKNKDAYSNSSDLCNLALMLDPENVKAKYRLGLSAYFRGNYENAVNIFEALEDRGDSVENLGQLAYYLRISRQHLDGEQMYRESLEKIQRNQYQAMQLIKRNRRKDGIRLLCRNVMYIEKLYMSLNKMESVTKNEVFRLTMKYRFEISDLLIGMMSGEPEDYSEVFAQEWDKFLDDNGPGSKKILSNVLTNQFRFGCRFDLPKIITEKATSLIRTTSESDIDPLDENTRYHIGFQMLPLLMIEAQKRNEDNS